MSSDYDMAARLQEEWDAEEVQKAGGSKSTAEGPIVISDSSDDDEVVVPRTRTRAAADNASSAFDADLELARQLQEEFDREVGGGAGPGPSGAANLGTAAAGVSPTGPSRPKRRRESEDSDSSEPEILDDTWKNASLRGSAAGRSSATISSFLGLVSKVAEAIPTSQGLETLLGQFSEPFKCPKEECRKDQAPFGHIDATLAPSSTPSASFLPFLKHCCEEGKCQACGTTYCIACHEPLDVGEDSEYGSRTWADHCPLLRLLLEYAVLVKISKVITESEAEAAAQSGTKPKPARTSGATASPPARGAGGRGRGSRGGRGGRGSGPAPAGTGYASSSYDYYNYSRGGDPNARRERAQAAAQAAADTIKREKKMDQNLIHLFSALIFLLPNSSTRVALADLVPHDLLPILLRKSPLTDILSSLLRNDSFLEITGASDGWEAPQTSAARYLGLDGGLGYGGEVDYDSDDFDEDMDEELSAYYGMPLGSLGGSLQKAAKKSAAATAAAAPPAAPKPISQPKVDTEGRSKLYFKALDLILAIVSGHELLAPVILDGFDTKEKPQAKETPSKKHAKVEEAKFESEHVPSIIEMLGGLLRQADVFIRAAASTDEMLEDDNSTAAFGLALEMKKVGEDIRAAADRVKALAVASSSGKGSSAADNGIAPKDTGYTPLLKDLVFGHADLQIAETNQNGKHNQHLLYGAHTNVAPNKLRTSRLVKETATLSTSLPDPLPATSIFLRVDEEKMDKMRFIITGPVDTPYAFGCFLFDMSFGESYPHAPPAVKLLTTGGGTVRFNPNLYADGKVCLSLLGTWAGSPEEQWQPNKSTLYQVFLSIQTFILVSLPYYNEPGFGNPRDSPESRKYNANLRRQTVRWAMLEMLRKPPAGFKDVVHRHFWWLNSAAREQPATAATSSKGKNKAPVTRGRLMDQVITWAEEDKGWDGKAHPEGYHMNYVPKGKGAKGKTLAEPVVASGVVTEGEFASHGVGWSKLLTDLHAELTLLEEPKPLEDE